MFRIVHLSTIDPAAVETLLDAAFGADRHGRTAYRIRDGMTPIDALSFAAIEENGGLVGALQSWPVALTNVGGEEVPLVLVGPVAVAPTLQRAGAGRALMTAMLAAADAEKAEPQVLIGDPEYYGRFFGFMAQATTEWEVPGPVERRRLLARASGRTLPRRGMLGPRRWTTPPSPR